MKTEQIEIIFIDEKLLPRPNYTVYRLKVGGGRVYYTVDESGEPTFAISLTTLTKHTLPTSPHLIKWIAQLGYEESQRYMMERADYGTLMHLAIGDYVINKGWNTLLATAFIQEKINKGIITRCTDVEFWAEDLNNDMAAFAQFVYEYKVQPMAIELVLVSKEGYGTLIDLVCKMTIEEKGYFGEVYKSGENKNKPKESKRLKEITALLNFKSGKKGFYEEHEIQLELEKKLFEENYPDVKIDAIFNWSPKEWQKTPTFNLKDQTDTLNIEKAEHLLAIAKIELMKKLPNERIFTEEIKYGEPPLITEKSVADIIREQHKVELVGFEETPVS